MQVAECGRRRFYTHARGAAVATFFQCKSALLCERKKTLDLAVCMFKNKASFGTHWLSFSTNYSS